MKLTKETYEADFLLGHVKTLPSYKTIPDDYWLLGIRSADDNYNLFDDIFTLFFGERPIVSAEGTTNAGAFAMKNFEKYNKEGVAIVKSDEWYYDLWKPGLHNGKMKALRQANPVLYYRDGDKDEKIEEKGALRHGMININFHASTYIRESVPKTYINEWSAGCQVIPNDAVYYAMIDAISQQDFVTYCLIKQV